MAMNESARHVNLLHAFDQPRCPICTMVKRDMQQDMDTLMLERINKVETHYQFRAGRGLCNAHAWQIKTAKGGSMGIAVMYDSTLLQLLKDAEQWDSGGGGLFSRQSAGERAATQLEPSGACLLCASMNHSERAYVAIVAQNLHDDHLHAAYTASRGGVCLPHGRMVLQELTTKPNVRAFLSLQVPKWRALQADLQLFIQKNEDNIPQHEMGAEGDSWQRAIAYLSGDETVFGYRR